MDSSVSLCIGAVLIGLLPAAIARSKGRSFVGWWIFGAALFIIALPMILVLPPDTATIEAIQLNSGNARKCPFCAEIVKGEAVVCKHCGRDLPAIARLPASQHESDIPGASIDSKGSQAMNTRTPVDLGTLTRSVSIGKVREIVNEYRKQGRTEVFTSDVIRGYAGHFLKNTGSSPALSFNANFGKILQANAPSLHIAEIRKHVSIRDDAGESTSSSEWKL